MKNFQTISDNFFLQFTMFPCKFNSPRVKHNLVSSIINFAFKLPHMSPDTKCQYFRKLKNEKKIPKLGDETGQYLVSPPKINFWQ